MITRILDGPAVGQEFVLRRAPVMLRVVHGPRGWDALDQPEDSPADNETVYVYRMEGEATVIHVSIRGAGRKNAGYYASGHYRLLNEQPHPMHTRTNAAWAAWCELNRDKLLAGRTK